MVERKPELAARAVAAVDTSQIPGWGVDADPRNDPTYPMRNRAEDDAPGMNWRRPPQQGESVEVLQSIEHVRRPAVFGTSTPPSGLSGVIRRQAFVFSESQWMHWLLLILADRINTVEGVLDDLGRGHIPNLYKEMGMGADLQHNKRGVVSTTAGTVVVFALAAGAVWWLSREREGDGGVNGGGSSRRLSRWRRSD